MVLSTLLSCLPRVCSDKENRVCMWGRFFFEKKLAALKVMFILSRRNFKVFLYNTYIWGYVCVKISFQVDLASVREQAFESALSHESPTSPPFSCNRKSVSITRNGCSNNVTVKLAVSVKGKMSMSIKSRFHHLVRETNPSLFDRKLEVMKNSLEKRGV